MTLSRLIATGSGRLAARIEIEGLPAQFVSDPGMERAAWPGANPGNTILIADQSIPFGASQLTLEAASAFVEGPEGERGAREFSANAALGACEYGCLTAALDAFTFTCWVSLDTAQDNGIFSIAGAEGGSDIETNNTVFAVRVTAGGVVEVFWEYGAGTNATFTSSASIPADGDWYRLDVVRRSTGEIEVYVDNTLADSTSGTTAATGGDAGPLAKLGEWFNDTNNLDGRLWGVAFRSRALLQAEVEAEGILSEPDADTVGLWCVGDTQPARVYCFDLFGEGASTISLSETVNIPEAKLESEGTQLRLWETTTEQLAQIFCYRPDSESFIGAKVEDDDTTITLFATGGISDGDVVHIGTEAIRVGTVDGEGGLSLGSCERGHWGTIAQAHWTFGDAEDMPFALMTNRPLRVRGRRVRIYLYGDGDDLQGDGGNGGEPVWRGFVTAEPTCSDAGTMWGLQIGPLARVLDSKLGGELEVPASPRGVYYSWAAPLWIQIWERGTEVGPITGLFTGFYETQQAFVDALTVWLGTGSTIADAAFASTFVALEDDSGGWTIEATVGALVTSMTISIWSNQDGYTSFRAEDHLGPDGEPIGLGSLTTGERIYPRWVATPPGGRRVPRGIFGEPEEGPRVGAGGGGLGPPTVAADATTWPENRVYLDKPVGGDWTALSVSKSGGGDGQYRVADSSTAENWVELESDLAREAGSPPDVWFYSLTQVATLSPSRAFTTGSLADFRDQLVVESVEYANRGTAPFVTTADLADWTTVVERAGRLPHQRRRVFVLTSPVELLEVLAAEWQLLGVFPITDSAGKIGLAEIGVPNASTSALTSIDDEIISVGWSTMRRGNQTINRVVLSTGYTALEDEWKGREFEVIDRQSQALDHQDRPLAIQPRSYSSTESIMTPNDAAEIALPVLALFGYPHDFVEVHVSWKLFEVRLGDAVSFSADHLPDYRTGRRPIDAVSGVVTGRTWVLGEAHGTLTVLLSWTNVAGYSPTARVLSQSNVSGNTWDITINHTLYAPRDGTAVDEFFEAGYQVRVVQYDSESPTTVAGEVVSVDTATHVIRVLFDGTWTPGASTWELIFDDHGGTGVTDAQNAFAALDQGRTYAA